MDEEFPLSPFIIEIHERSIIQKFRQNISKRPFKDRNQVSWVGKPFLPLGKLQFEIYYKAFHDIERVLGIKFQKKIVNNDILYVTEDSLRKITEYFYNADLETLKDFNTGRQQSYNDMYESAKKFALGIESFQNFAVKYQKAIFFSHLRWRFTEAMQKCVDDKYFPDSLKNYKNRVFEALPQEKLVLDKAMGDFNQILHESQSHADLFHQKSLYNCMRGLERNAPGLWKMIGNYARTYLIDDYEDIRLPVPYLTFLYRVKQELRSMQKNTHNNVDLMVMEKYPESMNVDKTEIPPEIQAEIIDRVKPQDVDEFWCLIKILGRCGVSRENEHHVLISTNCYFHEALLSIALQSTKLSHNPYNVFEITCDQLQNFIESQ